MNIGTSLENEVTYLPVEYFPMCLAIPGKIESITGDPSDNMKTGKVNFGGILKTVNLSLVPEAKVSDYVLVHVGVALSIVDEMEAKRTMNFLEGLGELDDLKIDENL